MKIVRFSSERIGHGRIGVVDGESIVDVTKAIGGEAEEWPPVLPVRLISEFDRLRPALEAAVAEGPRLARREVTLETPIPWPHKLIAIPVNYHAHALEMSSPAISINAGFFILSNSSLSGADEPIVLPDLPGRQIHHEAEVAVIIGRRGRHIAREDAREYIFGLSCLLDITVRGRQERAIRKSYDTFTPVGPWIVTADEVGAFDDLDVHLWVNGDLRQKTNTRHMIMDIPQIVEMCSSVMTLEPGDIIATGTGEGVGPIHAGDEVKINISRVGAMSVRVEQGAHGANVAIPYDV